MQYTYSSETTVSGAQTLSAQEIEAFCAIAYDQRRPDDQVLFLASGAKTFPTDFPYSFRSEETLTNDDSSAFGLVVCLLDGLCSLEFVRILDVAKRCLVAGGTLVVIASFSERYHLDRHVTEIPVFTKHHLRAMLEPWFDKVKFEQLNSGSIERKVPIGTNSHVLAVCKGGMYKKSSHRVSIVIPLFNQAEYTLKALNAILTNTSSDINYEVVLVNNASTDNTRPLLKGLGGDVVIVHNDTNLGFAAASNQGALAAGGDVLVFLNNDTEVHVGWLEPLLDELSREPDTGIVGARLLFPDGTIQHAGVAVGRDRLPKHVHQQLAADHPLVMERREFPIVTAACAAVRREQFLSMGMFDEGFDNGHEDIDLCFRYAELGMRAIYRPDSVVTHHESISVGRLDTDRLIRNRARTLLKWRERLVQDDYTYCCSQAERIVPVGALRWAIKIGPPDRFHANWGDSFYAESLARELVRAGHEVRIDYLDEWGSDDLDIDVVVHIKGLSKYHPKPYNINIMWMLNHPTLHTTEELSGYDAVLVASKQHAKTLKGELGVPILEFLQATDTRHFSELTPKKVFDVVFVGNNGGSGRLNMRKAVADLLPSDYTVGVWGQGWKGLLPKGMFRGEFAPWEQLPIVYSMARIVLNDHQPEMREFGFVNNRTFDASCCGAVVVSDTVNGMEQVLDVPTYKDRDNLKEIIDELLADEDKRRQKAAEMHQEVLRKYSFIQRAEDLVAIANDLIKADPGDRVRETVPKLSTDGNGPLVSVLMSTYNRRTFLKEAIASVVAQKYSNWELIVVRDGGAPVDDIVQSFNDQRITLMDNEQNKGKGNAINQAWELSKGKYVAYLDDDDIYYPNHLERHVYFLENVPNISMTVSNTLKSIMSELPNRPGEFVIKEQALIYSRQVTIADLTHENKITWLSVVHARELFEKAGGMDEKLSAFLDFDLWRRMAAISYPYHINVLTAEYYFREYDATSGAGQITRQHRLQPMRYQANKLRVLSKRLPLIFGSPVEIQARRAKDQARYEYVMERATYFAAQNDLERAKISCRLATKMKYNPAEATRQLGLLELKSGNYSKAIQCALECLTNQSWEQPIDHFLAAQAYAAAGKLNKTEEYLNSLAQTEASDSILKMGKRLSIRLDLDTRPKKK
ncbi:glycosyltransferase [Maridesulfovibrio sp.]|uniref:glycosyltransferase n=1 Tax=Maridesulfovibrio sp. TaxID=2795000 RepID=UPI003AFFC10E